MSVIIKAEIEKPESCCDCPFAVWAYEFCECKFFPNKIKTDKGKDYLFHCPIKETKK